MVQEITGKRHIFVVNSDTVPEEDLTKNGATNVKVRYLVDERHGADRFALRLYTVEKGGHTPLDEHVYEHQVYVLSGEALLREKGENGPSFLPIRKGDSIFIPSNAAHQFVNERDEPLVFLCVKGNPKLYRSRSETQAQASVPEDSDRNFC